MKKNIGFIFILVLVCIVLFYSFRFNKDEENVSFVKDVISEVNINDDILNVNYVKGNMIDETLIYGNSFSKSIIVTNKNDKLISYSLSLKEKEISNELITYSAYVSIDDGEEEEIIKNKTIDDDTLIYNLGIEAGKKITIKLVFTANKEGFETNVKGRLVIATNLTEKEIFIQNVRKLHSALMDKINSLNGISIVGFYMIDANSLLNIFNGNILIDARDISDLKFYYSVTSGKYMIDDYQYNGELKKKSVLGAGAILDSNQLCLAHTKKGCLPFSSIPYDESGGVKAFLNNSKLLINNVKSSFNKTDKKVYIMDVTTDTKSVGNIRGYVLCDNTKENTEYFLYITDNVYMISGYNYTKYGDYTEDSGTIRAFKESSFNLSSSSKATVCSFTGFSECYSMNEEKV